MPSDIGVELAQLRREYRQLHEERERLRAAHAPDEPAAAFAFIEQGYKMSSPSNMAAAVRRMLNLPVRLTISATMNMESGLSLSPAGPFMEICGAERMGLVAHSAFSTRNCSMSLA